MHLQSADRNRLWEQLAAVACIGMEREVFTIADEYGWSVAQMDVSLPTFRDRDKRFAGEQSLYSLLDKRELGLGLRGVAQTKRHKLQRSTSKR